MPEFSTKRRVRHTAADMFDLVADVKKYPEFVPLCSALTIKSRNEKEDGTIVLVADMTVAYKIIRETFTSRVTLDRTNLDDPCRIPQWTVQAHAQPLEYFIRRVNMPAMSSFSSSTNSRSRTLAMLMGAMFDAAFRRFALPSKQRPTRSMDGRGCRANRPARK